MKPHPQHGKVSANKTGEKEKEERKKTEDEEEDDENKPHGVYVRICPERRTREVKAGKTKKTKSRLLSTY